MLLSLTLGFIAAIADIVGGLVLVRRNWEKRYLRYFRSEEHTSELQSRP